MGVEANSAEALARQNCATILLQRQANKYKAVSRGGGRSFKCKSCDRAFETFQALGGHRASHKRLRIQSGGGGLVKKAHECRECRVGFPTGQALGGHMRKHVDLNAKRKRAADDDDQQTKQLNTFTKSKINLLCLNLDLNFPPPLEDMYYSGFFQGATVG